MNRKKLGLKLHQDLSFSSTFQYMSHSKHVFWPGCALMKLDPSILEKTLAHLRLVDAEMGISSFCCGSPTRSVFPEKLKNRRDQIFQALKKREVETIYTACPSCLKDLRSMGLQVEMIWPMLLEAIRIKGLPRLETGPFNLQDPCPLRREKDSHESVRSILEAIEIDVVEVEASRDKTICCGEIEMLHITDTPKSEALRDRRLSSFDHPVIGYCEGCVSKFKPVTSSIHLLELLFGESGARTWMNRYRNSRGLR